nr:MAG: RNA-dependent RNA polymerase [Cannabis partiti-like virus]
MAYRTTSSHGTSTSYSSFRRPKAISRLPRSPGFAFDLSQPREDPLARRAVEHVFGKAYVDSCFARLHRSTMSYEALVSDLFEFDRLLPNRPVDDPVYAMVLESVRQDLHAPRLLVPHTIGAVTKLPDFPRQKSPGLPYKNMGYKTKGEVVDDTYQLEEINRRWHYIGFGSDRGPLPDTCLFARSQVCDVSKQKVRGVWGYPLFVYLEEARFFYPILEHLKSKGHNFPIGYGCEISKGGLVAISEMALRVRGGKYMMTDWSKFDKSIPPWLIRDAFSLLAELIDFDHVVDSEGLQWHVRGYRSKARWKKIVDYFVETPVRTCKGERFLVRSGVPSGSCFTNVIDTIINCIVTRYISYNTVGSFPLGEMYLGDDGVCVFSSSSLIDLRSMAALAHERFGLVLSPDKSYVTTQAENIHFLGYYNRPIGMPNRDQALLIVSFVHPEKSRETAVECAAAALGQLWANFDPLIAESWFRVLCYVSNSYEVEFGDVLIKLRQTAHRHKYLSHIGRSLSQLTVPTPCEFGGILEIYASPVPSRYCDLRYWDYGDLYRRARLRWLEALDLGD